MTTSSSITLHALQVQIFMTFAFPRRAMVVWHLVTRGGGGKALVERMLHLAQTAGAKFMATVPLDTDGATFWARAGFAALLLLGSKSSW